MPTSEKDRIDSVSDKLAALEEMDANDLRAEWRRLYRAQPPARMTRDLLKLGVAWKIQEQAYGGYKATTKRQLVELTGSLERTGDVTRRRVARLKPGARLAREWGGRTHTVTVLDNGFDWNGERWRSLSAIAREITGARWSGPRFFGLTGTAKARAEGGDHA